MSFDLLPAVDVVDGQAVRLVQGEAGTETGYGDPLDAARGWVDDGAEWIDLVDLDAAFRRGSNAALLAALVEQVPVKVELSGGIRDDDSLRRALDTGCARVNIGTAALEDPAWCAKAIAEFGERVAVGTSDVIRTASAGWPRAGGSPTAATCGTSSPGSTPRAARATWSPTSAATGRSPARTPTS